MPKPSSRKPAAKPAEAQSLAPQTFKPGTKQAALVDRLSNDTGATVPDLSRELGWLPHTTRAALTGLRKRGFAIVSTKDDTGTRYRIASEAAA